MKLGTKSLLFGVHQVFWHPFTVWRAWKHLYGRPGLRECVCILIHDWGYWGCANMDGEEGRRHPFFAAEVAGFLFGVEYFYLVCYHSRHLAESVGAEPSKLCWADKLSMIYEPRWFYLLRARASGEILEYRANAAKSGFLPEIVPDEIWHDKLVRYLAAMSHEKAVRHAEVHT